ncbi:hypothetical protein ASPZODRAFT_126923 [Penicilliopsis zonata CBS 506.65]|uniref:EH domain-containing protein n=1 Tax=Penicilliopsis zonata CBS 506.65 TaxID=1073090 RepID=A0A1L9SUS3_9EURO|nr:hypothetical protein ASPZODRAFT_126923 [Penicilliopsis zonata CBS 506.65]OJJ50948.1 hypothetical protein ASPZODRAFT_126923 [Penicilliopsis zonata CBS 506.65]
MNGWVEGTTASRRLPNRGQGNAGNENQSRAAALQGAALAFQASSARIPLSDVKDKARRDLGALSAAMLAGNTSSSSSSSSSTTKRSPERGNDHQDTSRARSPPPPELGSVRDKIGRYTAISTDPSPAELARAKKPQQIAARLAAERSPEPKQKPGLTPNSSSIQQAEAFIRARTDIPPREYELDQGLLAPRPIRQIPPKPIIALDSLGADRSPPRPLSQRPASSASSYQMNNTRLRLDRDDSLGLMTGPPLPIRTRPSVEPPGPRLPPKSNDRNIMDKPARTPYIPPTATLRSHDLLQLDVDEPESSPLPPRRPVTSSAASFSSRSQAGGGSGSLLDLPIGLDEGALSDAIVASSLASARISPAGASTSTSTAVPPPVPPPRRRQRAHSLLHPGSSSSLSRKDTTASLSSRTPSPKKTLRTTLREPPSSSDDEDSNPNQRRTRLIRKHPHKHHEGDRRRYRSEITERERKRYEGVWAANKGLFVYDDVPFYPANASSEMVLNLVVRDIWSRSRLPPFILEQIWDLVDQSGIGLLSREEFVVGMWLIDQRLKGHKLPSKVPESVWEGVRHIPGLKP